MFRKIISFIVCILFAAGLFPAFAESDRTDLVIMLYMTGGDLESAGGAASDDLEEIMRNLPDTPDVKVVAMISGSVKWRLDIPSGETSVYEVMREGLSCVQQGDSRSMGAPGTLTDFLAFTESAYPADRYALILWDHGAGPLVGVCFDETFKTDGDADRLTLDELAGALSASPFAGKKLSFVGFDACLMSTLEVAAAMAPFAEYMVASQETEPPCGWNYAFLRGLTGSEPGDEIGKRIISSYADCFSDSVRAVTLSCLDLGKARAVCASLGAFFAGIEPEITTVSYPEYTRIRSVSKALGISASSYYDLVDLPDLITLYQENGLADGTQLLSDLDDMIVCHYAANDDYVNGISIYYPFDNKSKYESGWASVYSHLDFVPEYQSFIRKISDIFIGEALLNWNSSYQVRLQEEAGVVKLSMDLSPEELKNVARSRLVVVEELQEGAYQQIYVDYDNLRRFDDAISASYHGEALYVVDESGMIIAGPLTYYPVDGGISVSGLVYYDIDWDAPFIAGSMSDSVRLIYRMDPDGNLTFTDIFVIGEDKDTALLPSAVDIPSLMDLILINSGPLSGYESISALDKYELIMNWIYLDPSKGAPRLAFLPVYGQNNRYAYIRLTDMQGNTALSEVVRVPNPSLIPVASAQTFEDSDSFLLALDSADLVSGYGAGIKCVFRLKNRTGESCTVSAAGVSIDSVPAAQYTSYNVTPGPGEEAEIVVYISGKTIRESGVREAGSISVDLQVTFSKGGSVLVPAVIPVQLNTAIFASAEE